MGKLKLKAKPEAKPKAKRKNAMASAFSRLAHESMTPAQRVARGKRAAAARWHKSKPPAKAGPWYGLVALPADYVWKGAAHASKVLDAARADSANVVFSSQNRKEVVARSQMEDLRDRFTLIDEYPYNPHALHIKWEYEPDMEAMKRLLRVDVEGGKS
jgi:hypothetical protein